MSLFRLDASIRTEGSHSRQIADIVEQEWRNAHPADPVINREIGIDPLPSTAWATAAFARYTPEEDRSPEQREAIALAATLTDELAAADALLFAVPLYNFGVSQHFKTWVDLVITDPRMGAGSDPILAGGRPCWPPFTAAPTERAHPEKAGITPPPWMRRILEDVWKLDLRVVEAEFTLVGVNPQLDEFKELAAQMRSEAEELARAHGRSLSTRLAA